MTAIELSNEAVLLMGQARDLETAGRYLEKALALEPNNPHVLSNFGAWLLKIGRHKEALECFFKSVNVDKQNVSAMYSIGFILQESENFQQALEYLTKAVELDPKLDPGWFYKAKCLRKLGRNLEAAECDAQVARLRAAR